MQIASLDQTMQFALAFQPLEGQAEWLGVAVADLLKTYYNLLC